MCLTHSCDFFLALKSEQLYSGFCTRDHFACCGSVFLIMQLLQDRCLMRLKTACSDLGHSATSLPKLPAEAMLKMWPCLIGNAGEPASIKCIPKFLPMFSLTVATLSSRIHADAALALRKIIAKKDPVKVTSIIVSEIAFDSAIRAALAMWG